MTNLSMYEFESIAWDELYQSDDHIVPHPGYQKLNDCFVLGESNKKDHFELAGSLSNNRGRFDGRCVDQGREQVGFATLSKRRNTMLDKDLWSPSPNGAFPSASDIGPIQKASSLTSDNTMASSHDLKSNKINMDGGEFHGHDTVLSDKTSLVDDNSFSYSLGDIDHTSSDLDFFENAENKDSNDFLCHGWPEIGNFEDVDMMFRNCDSTFGLGASKEDDLGWLSSADDLGGSEDVLKSDVNFPCPEPNVVQNISENLDSFKGSSINDSTKSKNNSWTSDKTDTYMSSVIEPAFPSKDGFITREQGPELNGQIKPRMSTNSHSRTGGAAMINKNKKHTKLQNKTEGKSKGYHFATGSFNHSELTNDVMELSSGLTCHQAVPSVNMQQQTQYPNLYSYLQNPISYGPSDSSHLSDPASVNLKPSPIKSETNDLTSFSTRDSSNISSQLQYMESSDHPFDVPDLAMREKREKLHSCRGSQSSVNSSLKNGNVTMFDPGSVGKYENCTDHGVNMAIPAELVSSNVEESLTMHSGLDDISLETASFLQLQLVMEQLDLRTKLCIRDSLYRLAHSAEQRHYASLNIGCEDERRSAGGASIAEGANNSFMDMETNTNPIDRSIAHLLFHRASDSSTEPAHDSFPFNPQVHGSVASPPIFMENLVGEGTASEVEKVSEC